MRLLYMHPPKCAGTSVGRSFKLRFLWKGMGLSAHSMRPVLKNCDPQLDYDVYQVEAHRAADAVAAHQISNGKNLIAGHFWYGKYLRLVDRDVHRMTVVRDPVKRFVSHYRYLVWKYDLKADLDEFLASDRSKQIGSIYGFYFANRYPESQPDEDKIVERSIETLKSFSLIGDVNSISNFISAARSIIGGPLIPLRSNKTPGNVKPDAGKSMTDEQLERINEVTSIDRRIYDAVVTFPNYAGKKTVDRQALPTEPVAAGS